MSRLLYPPGKTTGYTLDWIELDGWAPDLVKTDRLASFYAETQPRFPGRRIHRTVTTLTGLSRLLCSFGKTNLTAQRKDNGRFWQPTSWRMETESKAAHILNPLKTSGYFMYRHVWHSKKSTFCPLIIFMYFVWISEQTAIISLDSVNWLGFITETDCVYSAVRNESLHITVVNFHL